MKETGFILLLHNAGFSPANVGFMKDDNGRRGVSCKITINEVDYAIWFLQKDFPKGIYVIAVTKLQSCTVFPMYKYLQTKNLQDVFEFIKSLKGGVDKSHPENIVHPWSELCERIMTL